MFGLRTLGNIAKKVGQGVVSGAKAIGQGVVAGAKVVGQGIAKVAPVVSRIGNVVGNVAGVAGKIAGALGQPEFAVPLMGIAKGAKAVAGVAGAVGHIGQGIKNIAESRSVGDLAKNAVGAIESGREAHQMYRGGREDIQFGHHAGRALFHRGRELYRR